jgi:hypothetical protein
LAAEARDRDLADATVRVSAAGWSRAWYERRHALLAELAERFPDPDPAALDFNAMAVDAIREECDAECLAARLAEPAPVPEDLWGAPNLDAEQKVTEITGSLFLSVDEALRREEP